MGVWFSAEGQSFPALLGALLSSAGDCADWAAPTSWKEPGNPRLFTIGYEGRTAENYFLRLRKAGITLVCDVRRNPLSRKRGFSKKALAKECEKAGIAYEHLPELGIASAERKNIRTPADRAALFQRYRHDTLPKAAAALGRIQAWLADAGQRVALTCFEADPAECHRHCVAEVLQKTTPGLGRVVDL